MECGSAHRARCSTDTNGFNMCLPHSARFVGLAALRLQGSTSWHKSMQSFDCGWYLLSRGVAKRKILEIWVS